MMLNPGSSDIPIGLILSGLFIIGIIGVLIGVAWIIRIARRTDDGSAHWRYRDTDSGRRARFGGRPYDGGMKPDRAPGYWPTRVLLAVAIIATIAVLIAASPPFWPAPTFGFGPPHLLGLPSYVVLSVVAAATAVIGLIWTIRIFRGPRDEPPPWRYRDR